MSVLQSSGHRERTLTLPYSAVQATFWMSYCVFIGFAAVYLQALGYSNAELGAVLAAGSLFGSLLGPALSSRIDRDARCTAGGLTPPVLAAQAIAIAVLLAHPVKGISVSVGFACYIAFAMSVNSLNLKLYTDAISRGARVDYAFARGMGSSAYVLVSVALGALAERDPARVVPLAGAVLCALQFAAFLSLSRSMPSAPAARREEARGSSLAAFARKNGRFCALLFGTALIFYSHNAVCSFLINIVRNVGGDTRTMGVLNGFMAAVEIPVMLLYTRLFGKRDAAALLRASFVFFTLKAAAIALAPSVPLLGAAFVLQAPSFALYTAAIVPYVSKTIPHEDSAKAQSLAFTMTTVGSVLASLIAGRLYDALSVTATLWIGCAACAAGSAISIISCRSAGSPEAPQRPAE